MDIISYVRHGYNHIIDHVEGAPGPLAFPSRGARPGPLAPYRILMSAPAGPPLPLAMGLILSEHKAE